MCRFCQNSSTPTFSIKIFIVEKISANIVFSPIVHFLGCNQSKPFARGRCKNSPGFYIVDVNSHQRAHMQEFYEIIFYLQLFFFQIPDIYKYTRHYLDVTLQALKIGVGAFLLDQPPSPPFQLTSNVKVNHVCIQHALYRQIYYHHHRIRQ